MSCSECSKEMSYLEINKHWWCDRCLRSQEGNAPDGAAPTAATPNSGDPGVDALDLLNWIIGGIAIAIGVAFLIAGWTTLGAVLIGGGVCVGFLGPF